MELLEKSGVPVDPPASQVFAAAPVLTPVCSSDASLISVARDSHAEQVMWQIPLHRSKCHLPGRLLLRAAALGCSELPTACTRLLLQPAANPHSWRKGSFQMASWKSAGVSRVRAHLLYTGAQDG